MRSLVAGLLIFIVGVLVALLVLSGLVFEQVPRVPVLWFVAMLTGVGFGWVLFWLWGQARRRRAAVRSAVAADPHSSNQT